MNFRHKLFIPLANAIIGLGGVYVAMCQISLLRIAQVFPLSLMSAVLFFIAMGFRFCFNKKAVWRY